MESKTLPRGPVIKIVSITAKKKGYSLQLSHDGEEEKFHLSIVVEDGLGCTITGFDKVSQWLGHSNNSWAVRPFGQFVMRFGAGEEPEFPFLVAALDEVFSFARPLSWCPSCRNGRLFGLKTGSGRLFLNCEHCLLAYLDVEQLNETHAVEQRWPVLPSPATDDELEDSQWRELLPKLR